VIRAIGAVALLSLVSPSDGQQVAARQLSASASTTDAVLVVGDDAETDAAVTAVELPATSNDLAEALSGQAANLVINNAGANSFTDVYSIRGLANTPNFSKAAVTLYVDDVPTSNTFTNFPQLLGATAFEVYRGPQGDRFGKNSEAGVINVIVDPPGNAPRYSASLNVGSYDLFAAQAHAEGPVIAETLFASVSVSHLQRDGFLHNTFRDTHPDDLNQTAARVALRFVPAKEWKIDVVSEIHHSNDGVQRFVPLASDDPFEVAFDFDGRTRIDGDVQAIRISREDENGRWLSITSRRDWRLHPYEADFDYSPAPIVRGRFDLRQTQIAQEFRYESMSEGFLRWRAGLFVDRIASRGTETFASPGFEKRIGFDETAWEAAIFGQLILQLSERLELTLGLRVEHVDDEIERQRIVSFETPSSFGSQRSEWNAQPKIALEYKQSELVTFYGSSAYGYKSGGFSFLQTDPRFASFETERVWANEIGVRLVEPKTKRFEARAALFYNRVSDYQVERIAVFPDITIFNAPEVSAWGAEMELRAQVLRGWTVAAQLGYTRSEFDEFRDPFTGVSYAGNRTPFAPEFTVGLRTRYRTAFGIFAEAALIAAGETFYDEANAAFLRQAPYAQMNAQIGYEAKRFSVSVYVENLNDARYFTQKIGYAEIGTPAAPRTFGGMVSVKF
jgi:iron complex outermembrane receptor protein